MSSSSSVAEGVFARFLRLSLADVEEASPRAHHAMVERLAAIRTDVCVDGEPVRIEVKDGGLRVVAGAPERAVLSTSHRTLGHLLDGELSLHAALESGHVRLRGTPDELVRFHEALMAYLAGCVRAPGISARLEAYRRAVRKTRG